MKINMFIFRLSSLLLLLLAGANGVAQAAPAGCTPISSAPYTISAPGQYCLTNDIEFLGTSGDAISIAASDVTLDLDGWALYGPLRNGTPASVNTGGINASLQTNVTIQNGTVNGFARGIQIGGGAAFKPRGIVVRNMKVLHAVYVGIGIYWSTDAVVEDNKVQVQTTGYTPCRNCANPDRPVGIELQRGRSGRVLNNDVQVNGALNKQLRGISVWDNQTSVIDNNNINSTVLYHYQDFRSAGVDVGNSSHVIVSANNVTSFQKAVYVTNSQGVLYRDNTAAFTSFSPYSGGIDAGGNVN